MNNTKIKVLIVEDELSIAETVIAYLLKENIEAVQAISAEEALEKMEKNQFDLLILDWMLPGKSGVDLIKEIRQKSSIPILMLSARNDEMDKVICLEVGADDYVVKPFGPREVVARVHALLRRKEMQESVSEEKGSIADLEYDFSKHQILKNGELVDLTPYEFKIFKILCQKNGDVVSREKLMNDALGYIDFLNDRTLDTHIKNLRKKIETDSKNPQIIKTVRDSGFKINLSV